MKARIVDQLLFEKISVLDLKTGEEKYITAFEGETKALRPQPLESSFYDTILPDMNILASSVDLEFKSPIKNEQS